MPDQFVLPLLDARVALAERPGHQPMDAVKSSTGPDRTAPKESAPFPQARRVNRLPQIAVPSFKLAGPDDAPEIAAKPPDAASGRQALSGAGWRTASSKLRFPRTRKSREPQPRLPGPLSVPGRRRRVPSLLVITGVMGVSVEARQAYVSSIAASAFALVGKPGGPGHRPLLIAPETETIPAQFFTSQTDAVEWLRQYARED